MTIISYAQNYEDVMLWRALKHVQYGFYIDVGAAWPDEHSVTKAFYLNGWRGINIEPNPEFNQMLVKQRTEDINLKVAVGDREDRVMMKIIRDTGLSTISQAGAKALEETGWTTQEEEVRLTTLASICREHVKSDQPIHFLKVDVEGLEEAVLRGNDWAAYKPWIVVVEATLPMLQIESYEGWEPVLLSAGYVFVYADGLNRFYVVSEHPELFEAFKFPPNIFDGFTSVNQVRAEAKAQKAEAKAQKAEAKAQKAEAKAQKAENASNQYLTQLHAVCGSKSWRITAPFRWGVGQVRRLHQEGLRARFKALIKKIIRKIHQRLLARPNLRRNLVWLVRKLGLHTTLKRVFNKAITTYVEPINANQFCNLSFTLQNMTPRARQIYSHIKAAVEYQKHRHN